jgi:curved DNA-binding protein CbpA
MGYYQVLGLPWAQGVAPDQIRAAYRKAVMDCHPDKHLNSDARTRDAASRRFQALAKAYNTLRDPGSRRLYDEGKLFEISERF